MTESNEELYEKIRDNLPESFWKLNVWSINGNGHTVASVDVADRRIVILRILEEIQTLAAMDKSAEEKTDISEAKDNRPGFTEDELKALDTTSDLAGLLRTIVGDGVTRQADLRELIFHIHAIQNCLMSIPARRAYPEGFRMLGE